jgi:outer membrane usher protein FimD/PapC
VGLNILLDQNYSAATSYRVDRNSHSETARFTKGLPIGEGLGYDLSVDRSNTAGSSQQISSNIQYNTSVSAVRLETGQYRDQGQTFRDQRVSVAGSVVVAGGQFGFSRPITDSYAIVKVGEVAGVAVLLEGRPAALTNYKGIAVLPSLNANYENNIAIASDALPINLALTSTLKRVTPAPRSGTFLDFNPKKTQAFNGKLLVSGVGTAKPAEFSEIILSVSGVLQTLPTGRGGEFYVEDVPAGTYSATANLGLATCEFELSFPKSDEMFVDLGNITCTPQPAN